MKKHRRLLQVMAILFGVVLVAVFVPWLSIFSSALPCANTIASDLPAPGGKLRAVIFERDCGATTIWSTQVSILRRGESLPNWYGNTFIQEGRPSDVGLKLTWISPTTLQLEYPGPTKAKFGAPTTIESKVRGVAIKAIAY